jgi:Domain found in Dishevelled, Egl-10, and Pleckstrin (DEP)
VNPSLVPTVYICMPLHQSRRSIRAAAMVMQIFPHDVNPDLAGLQSLTSLLENHSNACLVLDLTALEALGVHIGNLHRFLASPALRSRTLLTQEKGGLWPSTRSWVQGLGYADLYAPFDAHSLATDARSAVESVALMTDMAAINTDKLAQYFSAMQLLPDANSARGWIRTTTGLDAETFCLALSSEVKAIDRTYHFKSYPSCFLGTEAVDWMAQQYGIDRVKAAKLGAALQKLGLLQHVVHEQPFADAPNFYRTTASSVVDRIPLGKMLQAMQQADGVSVKDRDYHGTSYPQCFVGSEAVDWLSKHLKIRRHEAEIALNRLHAFGMIAHVHKAHPVIDGLYFYRLL